MSVYLNFCRSSSVSTLPEPGNSAACDWLPMISKAFNSTRSAACTHVAPLARATATVSIETRIPTPRL